MQLYGTADAKNSRRKLAYEFYSNADGNNSCSARMTCSYIFKHRPDKTESELHS